MWSEAIRRFLKQPDFSFASSSERNQLTFTQSSRKLPLNDSMSSYPLVFRAVRSPESPGSASMRNPPNSERRVDPNSRTIEPRGERVGAGSRDAGVRSTDRNTGSRTSDRAKATQNAGNRQRANATHKPQQRSSTPAASGRSGGRRNN